jgi:hypothetical protein
LGLWGRKEKRQRGVWTLSVLGGEGCGTFDPSRVTLTLFSAKFKDFEAI